MENKRSLFSAIPPAIIAGIIIGMLTYFGLNFAGYKEYTAQAKVVTSNVENVDDASNTATTYAATINSPKIKQKTLETLGIDWNVGKLDSKLDIKPVANSSIIDITVSDTHKLRAEDLADQYADYSVRVINNIYNSGAEVMEYSYGLADITDNTLRYGIIAGCAGALLWALINMIAINSHNKKLAKAYIANTKANEVKEVREVKESEVKPDEKTTTVNKIDENFDDTDDIKTFEAGTTKVIDAKEINSKASSQSSSKYEILGKLPRYDKGELDV